MLNQVMRSPWPALAQSALVLVLLLLAHSPAVKGELAEPEDVARLPPPTSDGAGLYQIGVGTADITGPAAEVNLMGYAQYGQDSAGIHFRLRARTFIVQDAQKQRIVYVNCDLGMIDQAIKDRVVKLLADEFGPDLYHDRNVMVSATHTHSGPGGFLQYLLYTMTAKGFDRQNFNAICDGILRSIKRAHQSMQSGYIYYNEGEIQDANINRSPSAYLNNTASERALYKNNTDKVMYQLRFMSTEGHALGVISWFAVHPTSMNNTNRLISGDNKGWASLLMEREFNGPSSLDGRGKFVAAFSAANLGDVSPNIKGPHCLDTGLPCDFVTSTCNGKNELCVASGPGVDMVDSTRIIATRQMKAALSIFRSEDAVQITGPVQFAHEYVQMSNQTVTLPSGEEVSTCLPAMGYSFAAGTTDGPGAFNFEQGTTTPNPFWNLVRDFLSKPSAELVKCQHPKPILLATGQINFPYAWQPHIVATQMFRIGQAYIAGVPGEFSTMSGRRLRNTIRATIRQLNGSLRSQPSAGFKLNGLTPLSDELIRDIIGGDGNRGQPEKIVINGLSNAYSSYVATFEEYQVQRYEGASTIYGPHTLDAYLQQFARLTQAILTNASLPVGPVPPNLLSKQISLNPGVVYDMPHLGKHFGSVLKDVNAHYTQGETVSVTFVAGNPRNDLQAEQSFLYVERLAGNSSWTVVADDAALETRFHWKRDNFLLGQSSARIEWDTSSTNEPGIYRIRHVGAHKTLLQRVKPYEGSSSQFELRA